MRLVLTAGVLMLADAGRVLSAGDLYVSPNGNDAWSGSVPAPTQDGRDGPFATLSRARDEVRRLKDAGKLGDGAVVNLRAGTYRLTEALNNKAKLTMRKAYGFRTAKAIEIALYHQLGDLPEPESTHEFW
jgi:hypothetical protein